ncbi:MAG: glycosyltransferase family 2 protein [Meiothermus sp.]|nr:glycosyltransferase family 2 protein [Meiothermus sp.]
MRAVILIPAYNEAQTIAQVVKTCLEAQLGEVWVVSDGSTDATAAQARQAGAKVLELFINVGKGGAIQVGLEATRSEAVLLLDADLIGLRAEHLQSLLEPLKTRRAEATVGFFASGRWFTSLASRLTLDWSGQRAFRRRLLEGANLGSLGFAVELAMTRRLEAQRARVIYVPLPGLTHRTKEEKLGWWGGLRARGRMFGQLIRFRLLG